MKLIESDIVFRSDEKSASQIRLKHFLKIARGFVVDAGRISFDKSRLIPEYIESVLLAGGELINER